MVDLLSKSLGENSFCRYIVQAVGQRMLFILAVFTLAKGYPSRTDFLLSNPRQMDNIFILVTFENQASACLSF